MSKKKKDKKAEKEDGTSLKLFTGGKTKEEKDVDG